MKEKIKQILDLDVPEALKIKWLKDFCGINEDKLINRSVPIIRPIVAEGKKRWRRSDELLLNRRIKEGNSYKQISGELNRSINSIYQKTYQLKNKKTKTILCRTKLPVIDQDLINTVKSLMDEGVHTSLIAAKTNRTIGSTSAIIHRINNDIYKVTNNPVGAVSCRRQGLLK